MSLNVLSRHSVALETRPYNDSVARSRPTDVTGHNALTAYAPFARTDAQNTAITAPDTDS